MKAVLPRTGSVQAVTTARSSSVRMDLSSHESFSGIFSCERPKISMNLEMNNHKRTTGIRRALSESSIMRSETDVSAGSGKLNGAGSRYVPSRIPEEEAGFWPEDTFSVRSYGGNDGEKKRMGDYYRELLKSNPTDSLVLRNYGKFLQEVEKDAKRAEEYYGRAILASPGDGELLSLYGNLIWMTERNQDRAKSYFDQAVNASPYDCMVLGSYAGFMWEVEEEDDNQAEMTPAMVAAF